MPTWAEFLRSALDYVHDAGDRTVAEDLLEKEQFLDAAQVVVDRINAPDFAQFIAQTFRVPNFRHSEIHSIVQELDPKIVVTTNYDEVYENYVRQGDAVHGYSVCRYYEDHALNEIRSTNRLILKAHGCVSNPQRLVLTRASYFDAKRKYPSFYAILDALFLTNTILFLGAGLNDPDIQLVLENANISARSQHPHYALTPSGRHPSIVSAIKKTYNIELLEYPGEDHEAAIEALRSLRDDVIAGRALKA